MMAEPVSAHVQYSGKHAFTVDVEEWFQVGAFENTIQREDWPQLESRVEQQVQTILGLLSQADIKATFFCLGWVAKRSPGLLSQIHAAGHELACHGVDHKRLFMMTEAEFKTDVATAKKLIEDAIGAEIQGYRAPSFSLTADVWWAYDVLREEGFRYSSSIYPINHDHYGMPSAPKTAFWPKGKGGVLELPLTVCQALGRNLPASGGGYFRLLPYGLGRWMLKRAERQNQAPGIFYMHPWEIDPGQPFVKEASLRSRFRHYTGQEKMPAKLLKLFRDFEWGRMDEVLIRPVLQAEGIS